MDRKRLMELLKEKKVQDYSFTVVFFLVFSFFVYFAIRPNLITAFNLQKELQEVKLKNKEYETQILQIVNYQSTIEQYRDKFYLLDTAIPHSPNLAQVIDDVKKSAEESGTTITSLTTQEIDYKEKKDSKLATIQVNMVALGPLSQVQLLLESLMNQRRIKTIDALQLSKDSAVSEGYSITLQIEGYYL